MPTSISPEACCRSIDHGDSRLLDHPLVVSRSGKIAVFRPGPVVSRRTCRRFGDDPPATTIRSSSILRGTTKRPVLVRSRCVPWMPSSEGGPVPSSPELACERQHRWASSWCPTTALKHRSSVPIRIVPTMACGDRSVSAETPTGALARGPVPSEGRSSGVRWRVGVVVPEAAASSTARGWTDPAIRPPERIFSVRSATGVPPPNRPR